MCPENVTCEEHCKESGKMGESLVLDGEICPFQYLCQCTCPSCVEKCERQGRVLVHNQTNMFGCSVCNCQCDNPNHWKLCGGSNFLLQNGTFGYPQCQRRCAKVDCDVKCQGKGLGLIRISKGNCTVCDGCNRQ